jgi:glucose-1-phosphate thymidylyltransferase
LTVHVEAATLDLMSVSRGPVGFLPAAGRGLRFGASGYAKELFPLLFEGTSRDGSLAPRPIAQLALEAIRAAGADRCVTVVSPEKLEIVRVLGATDEGMSLAYVVQPNPLGIPDALRCARPWLEGADVVFAMPDTVVLPSDALAEVHRLRTAASADVMLGVFPTDEPERLGPVDFEDDGRVVRIHDKPAHAPRRNTWAIASWSPRFTTFCCDWDAARESRAAGERALGHAFQAALDEGLNVRAAMFGAGRFFDIGTPEGLRAALAALVTHGVLVPEQATAARGSRA